MSESISAKPKRKGGLKKARRELAADRGVPVSEISKAEARVYRDGKQLKKSVLKAMKKLAGEEGREALPLADADRIAELRGADSEIRLREELRQRFPPGYLPGLNEAAAELSKAVRAARSPLAVELLGIRTGR